MIPVCFNPVQCSQCLGLFLQREHSRNQQEEREGNKKVKAGPKDKMGWRRNINRPDSTNRGGVHSTGVPTGKVRLFPPKHQRCGSSTSYLRFREGVTCTKGLRMRREWRPRRRGAWPHDRLHQHQVTSPVREGDVCEAVECAGHNCQTQARVPREFQRDISGSSFPPHPQWRFDASFLNRFRTYLRTHACRQSSDVGQPPAQQRHARHGRQLTHAKRNVLAATSLRLHPPS